MELSEDDLKKIESFGILGYDFDTIIVLLNINDVKAFYNLWHDANSEVQKRYNKGVIHGKYKIDKMLFDKIAEGDLAALKMFEDRRKTKKP